MEKSKKRWLIVLGLVMLIGIILIGIVLGWFYNRGKAFNSRPLVLIHSPFNNDRIQVGERIIVHATAREDQGLERIEIWANGTLIDSKEAPESTPTSMILSSDWTPTYIGQHLLIVQAVSKDGIQGQASVRVFADEAGQAGTGVHTVEEGETLESIAEDHGSSAEELLDLNPELDPGGPAPGDDLVVPDEEPSPEEDPTLPEEDREAPIPEGDVPLMGFSFGVFELFTPDAEKVTLRLEIPRLRTWETYDGLHCYLSLAGSLPQWYPDIDLDQATDESFAPRDHGWWRTAPDLEGSSAPVITWPGDQPLPLTVSCVGIDGGGTEAVELGQIELEIPPEEWNGIQQKVELDGEGGHLFFSTRVTQLENMPRGVPMYLDPDMTAPINADLNDRRRSLTWDYLPEPDEEMIDGFRIYLNGTLQWIEPADSRETGLPYEWFNPPCGSTYTFAVTAFRIGFPDGPESFPSIAILNQPIEECNREIQIAFLTLETFDLGGDGRYEDRHGDVGPVYGHFYANEKQITFNGGSEGPGLDMPSGLRHNTTYDLSEMSGDPAWRFSGMNRTIVDVPEGGTFEFGFHIMDRDTGRCRDSDDNGCNDLICDRFLIYDDNIYGEFDRIHEGVLTSENGRCGVSYRWGPAFDSPVGTGAEGAEPPLPWLSMTDFYVNEATGEVEIELRNTGTATWPWKDLVIELQNRSGDSLGLYTWPGFVLETGQNVTVTHPDMFLSEPYDACVVIDPFDDVPEGPERTGALFHNPICPQLPDLIITDAYYDAMGGGRIRVTVQNTGDGTIENRTLAFDTHLPDGTPLYVGGSYPDVSLEPRAIWTYDISGVSESIREQMAAGYVVTVNPNATILEENGDNNSFVIGEATRLWIYWLWINVPYDVRDKVEFHLDAYTLTGEDRLQVADWNIRQDIEWGSCFYPYHCVLHFDDIETYWFDIFGDEALEIIIRVDHPGTLYRSYTITNTFRAPTWGGGDTWNGHCHYFSELDYGRHRWVFDYLDGHDWSTRFNICRENYEE